MLKYILLIITILWGSSIVFGQYTIAGTIVNNKTKAPVYFAVILLKDNGLWATTNEKGEFIIKNVIAGKTKITIQCLGYTEKELEAEIVRDSLNMLFLLYEQNLTLDNVVVTAQSKIDNTSTAYVIDRAAIDHMQMLNVTDVTSLLPGGQTNRNQHLATSEKQQFNINGITGSENGNFSFGTAVEIDGIRLSNNSTFESAGSNSTYLTETAGVDTRNIASSNIESIEVITGIPSVEYGDLTNGMVKINTIKGKSPFTVEMATNPNTKQIAINKGLSLGNKLGILNASFEHTKSTSNIASPHTSYNRNSVTLTYSNTFNKLNNKPLILTASLTGNIGGYNSKADPDAYRNTYLKQKDNTIRGSVKLNWLLNNLWITNIEAKISVNYSDKFTEENTNKSSAASSAAIHSTENGYFTATLYNENPDAPIILRPAGYWYELKYIDNKPIDYAANIKANWAKKIGKIRNNIMLGADVTSSSNNGRGLYYNNMSLAPTWREYRSDALPATNNVAVYAEEKLMLSVGQASKIQFVAGIRSDITFINKSEYGTVNSFSPRFNLKYTLWENKDKFVRNVEIHAGWGKSVKLPSFEVLYPAPSYSDRLVFTSGSMADGTAFTAYHTSPVTPAYNPDLKWQYDIKQELGVKTNLKGVRISVVLSYTKTHKPYIVSNRYTPFSYKYTNISSLESIGIPENDRSYNIDQNTGIVTVHDKTGINNSQQLEHVTRNTFQSNRNYLNGSVVERGGVDWIIDFGKIRSFSTSFRIDGNYYYYKGVEETLKANLATNYMSDGVTPYKYIAYYTGSQNAWNGSKTKRLTTNLTVTTHIPKARLIFSLRVEGCLYNYSQYLSEHCEGERGFVIDSRESYEPSTTETDIYGGNRFVAVYPLYYVSLHDMETKIPFAEKFKWAKENDQNLYRELASMVGKTNYNYSFNPNKVSAYFSANLSVTKEISKYASISFNAKNFLNNMSKVKSSQTDTESTLYNSSRIPKLYYGLSLRIKL